MRSMMFDTLDLSRRLKASGFTQEQAETLADALNKAAIGSITTRTDLAVTTAELKSQIAELGADLKRWMTSALIVQTIAIVGITALALSIR